MRVCSICNQEIVEEEQEIMVCPDCGKEYHKSCWKVTGGMCVVSACREKAIKRKEEEEEKRKQEILAAREKINEAKNQKVEIKDEKVNKKLFCYACGTDLMEDQAFCPKCGTAVMSKRKNVCHYCGTELEQTAGFCPKCGNKTTGVLPANNEITAYNASLGTKKKSKKGLIIGIVSAFVALFIIVCSISGSKAQRVEEWKATALNFNSACWSCGQNLEDVGVEIGTYWRKYVYSGSSYGTYYNGHYLYDVDSAVAAAVSDNSAKISDIKSEWSQIQSYYNQLSNVPDTSDSEIATIWRDVQNAYSAIEDMYDCVINVSGNYNTFISTYNSCDGELADALSDLRNDLGVQ